MACSGAGGPLSVNDLAGYANLSKGQARRAAQTLVQQGLLLKVVSPMDARGVVLSLSPKSKKAWTRLQSLIERRNAEITECLSPEERQMLDALLDRLVSSAQARAVNGADDRGEPI